MEQIIHVGKGFIEKPKTVYETSEVITTNVYKVSPEQKKKLNRLAEERLKKAREEAIPKIRELYEQRVKEIRQSVLLKRRTERTDVFLFFKHGVVWPRQFSRQFDRS